MATAHIAETRAVIAEQKTLIERLTGVSTTSDPTAGSSSSGSSPASTRRRHPRWSRSTTTTAPAQAPVPAHDEIHTLTVIFHPGTTAVKDVTLEPAGVPMDDIVQRRARLARRRRTCGSWRPS